MDTYGTNKLTSNSYHGSREDAEINIDNIIVAVAELNIRILRLREEIVAFKNENAISLSTHNLSSLTPTEFNHSRKNGENRTGARYEPRRNFKGDDSPGGTDLSARLSFAKRAREVKAANEAAVFKEDYPRDDKSIEDDERPNRSRVSEPSGTYRKSISDAEKSGKETDERPGGALGDTGDPRISRVVDEKLRKLNEHRNDIVSETGCNPVNVLRHKIKRKRISRGVQCTSVGCRINAGRFFLNCFKSKPRRYGSTKKIKKNVLANKFNVESQNEVNKLLGIKMSDKSCDVIKEEIKSSDTGTRKEKFEEIGEEKIGSISFTYRNDEDLPVRIQNIDDEKSKDESKYRKVKINLLEKLRLSGALARKSDSKAQQNGSRHKSRNQKEEIAGLDYETKKVNDARKREDNSQSVKIVDREMDSSNGRKSSTSADRKSDVNKIKERLDLCIAELNGIIGDACALFDIRKNATKSNGQRC
ncbi:uncharacterized protein LOC118644569 [Monomorium pharaonis]|uniref:uncharacterized protein LOC118644569 n=1 Tax=Monomorium pharaonis TaxID=307658 RepID=UPI001747ABD9|nr:uncharacterized protein LOC118644569 [Monomorium pharaonis]